MGLIDRRYLWAVVLASLVGCQQPMRTPDAITHGQYGQARMQLVQHMADNRSDRMYLLDRMRVAVATMDDGDAPSAGYILEQVYDILRTQGINADKTVESVVLNEDLKFWKGEPFEQALALAYYSMQQASLGSWDNARAAADNALFYLKDFGTDDQGKSIDTEEIARRSFAYEQAIDKGQTHDQAVKASEKTDDYLDHGYVAVPSNFTLGYLLNGIANRQLNRPDEASDNFHRVATIDPALKELTQRLKVAPYNTVLVVAYGLGPEKVGYGPSNALARFAPRQASDTASLQVSVEGLPPRLYPQVLDVNAMASDHQWNNLEDVRTAKAAVGDVLVGGGLAAITLGAANHSNEAMIAGAGAMLAGAFLKEGAHVDTRYCDVMPQRFYVLPLNLTAPSSQVTLQVQGKPWSKLILTGLTPARQGKIQLRYVALVSAGPGPPPWAISGQVNYGNDVTGPMPDQTGPFILGGNDVRVPTERVFADYQASGLFVGQTLADLNELYRQQGIQYTREDQHGYAGTHVLEGGKSLVLPLAGTAGFARLLGQIHPVDETTSQRP